MPESRWKYIVVHHSFSKDDHNTRNWNSICKYHVEVNGWKMVGYHWGLEMEPSGVTVHHGRPLTMDGAHAIGFNRNGIGVCVVGNYDLEAPSESRLKALTTLCHGLMRAHDIPVENVIGHRETYLLRGVKIEKSCPGTMFDMNAFRRRLSDSIK